MDNFILLDGWTLTLLIVSIIFIVFCEVMLTFSAVFQEKENRKLKKENEKLNSELRITNHRLMVANSTLGFMKHRAQELEEEISVRDEAIVESLKGSTKNV